MLKIVKMYVFIAAMFVAMGCDNGDGNLEHLTGEGKVALRGYVQNAKVCLDDNSNFHCDESESSTVTDENGKYQIADLNTSEEDLREKSIIAEISETSISTEDNAVEKDTVLAAIPGKPNFISPMTTLVMVEMQRGERKTSEEAEAVFKNAFELGKSYSFDGDYVLIKDEEITTRATIVTDLQRNRIAGNYTNLDLDLTPKMIEVNNEVIARKAEINSASQTGSSESDRTVLKRLTNVPFVQGMDFGTGYNKINSSILSAAQCVESNLGSFELESMSEEEKEVFWSDKMKVGDIVVQRTAERNEVAYYFEVIESVEDLYNILDIDAKLELGIGDFSGTLEGGFMKEVSKEDLSVYSIFMIDAKLTDFKIVNPTLKYTVIDNFFKKSEIEPFRKKCGDNFLNVITTGGTYYGIMKIDTRSMQEKMEIEAHLKATYADKFSLEGQVSYRVRQIFEKYNAVIMTATKGVPGSMRRVSNFTELEHDVDQFYKNLAKNAGYEQVYPDPEKVGPCQNRPCLLDPYSERKKDTDDNILNACIPIDSFKYACQCEDGYVWDVEMERCAEVKGPCEPNPCNGKKHTTKDSCEPVGSFDYTCKCEGNWGYDANLGECVCKTEGSCKDTDHTDDFNKTTPTLRSGTVNDRAVEPVLRLALDVKKDNDIKFDKNDYRKAVYQVKFESYEQTTFDAIQGLSILDQKKEAEALLKVQRDKEVMDTLVNLWLRYDNVERRVKIMLAFPESYVGVIERDKWLRESILRNLRTYKSTIEGYAAACARDVGKVCPLVTYYSEKIEDELREYAENTDNVLYKNKYDSVIWLKSRDNISEEGDDNRPESMTYNRDGEYTIELTKSDLEVPEEMVIALPMERIVYPKTCAQRKKLYATNKSSGVYTLFMGGKKAKPYLIYCDDMDLSCSDINEEGSTDSPTNADDSYWCGPKEYLILQNSSPIPESSEDLEEYTPSYNFSRYSGFGAKDYYANIKDYDCSSAEHQPEEKTCQCDRGGKKIYYGVDFDGNGALEGDELKKPIPLCNTAIADDKKSGGNVIVESEVIPFDSNECPYGGLKLLFGRDSNQNSLLDSGEIISEIEPICNAQGSTSFSASDADKAKRNQLLTAYYKLRVLVNHNHLAVVPYQKKYIQTTGTAPYGVASSAARFGSTKSCDQNKGTVKYSDGSESYEIKNSANINLEGTPFIIKGDVKFQTDKEYDIEPVGAVWDDANRAAINRKGHLPIIRDDDDFKKYTRVMGMAKFAEMWTGLKLDDTGEYSWLTGANEAYSGIPFSYIAPWNEFYKKENYAFRIDLMPTSSYKGCVSMVGDLPVYKDAYKRHRRACLTKEVDNPQDCIETEEIKVGKNEYVEQFCEEDRNFPFMTEETRHIEYPEGDYNLLVSKPLRHKHPYIIVYKNLTSEVSSKDYQLEATFEYSINDDGTEIVTKGGNVTLEKVFFIVDDENYFFLNLDEKEAVGTSEIFSFKLVSSGEKVKITSGRLAGEKYDKQETKKALVGSKTYYVDKNESGENILVRWVRQHVDLQLSNKLDDGICGSFSSVNDLILTYDQELAEHHEIIEKLDKDNSTCEEGDTKEKEKDCGPNSRGTQSFICNSFNKWEKDYCDDSDVCVDGTTQKGSATCKDGAENDGYKEQFCTEGQWIDTENCLTN